MRRRTACFRGEAALLPGIGGFAATAVSLIFSLGACDRAALLAIESASVDSRVTEDAAPVPPRDATIVDARGEAAPAPSLDAAADACSAVVPEVLAALPPMGWNGFRRFQCSSDLDESKFIDTLTALSSTGMQAAGYRYVGFGDCWQASRASDGSLATDARFPSGLAVLARLVHERGFKLAVASTRGEVSCGSGAGSQNHEAADAKAFAAAGADLFTYNDCGPPTVDRQRAYQLMATLIKSQDHPILFGVNAGGFEEWMPSVGQVWRTGATTAPTWTSILAAVDAALPSASYVRYGAWSDPDVLQLGNGTLTESEARAQISLWSIFSAPLFVSNDLTRMGETTRSMLTQPDIIALDQDRLGLQAAKEFDDGTVQVFAKPLASCGARAVVVLNRGLAPVTFNVDREAVWLAPGPATTRDLWNATTTTVAASDPYVARAEVAPHDVVVLKIVGTEVAVPRGTVFMSDLPVTYVNNFYGPLERDMSNGERAARDGSVMRLRGKAYTKGLGAHGPMLLRYRLGGACTRFLADVGVDDEVFPDRGTVSFQVWGDGKLLKDTGVLTSLSPVYPLNVDVTGVRDLRLFVGNANDGVDYDHGDWADARIECP